MNDATHGASRVGGALQLARLSHTSTALGTIPGAGCTGFSAVMRVNIGMMPASNQEPFPGDDSSGSESLRAYVGSGKSFEEFYRSMYQPTVRLVLGMTGDIGIAHEHTQEAMLSVWRNWRKVQGLDRPDLWVRRVVVNRVISYRRRRVPDLRLLAASWRHAASLSDVDRMGDPIWDAVRRLPPRQAAAIVLWAVDGHTFSEIGQVLDCGEATARTHMRRARARLATELGGTQDV